MTDLNAFKSVLLTLALLLTAQDVFSAKPFHSQAKMTMEDMVVTATRTRERAIDVPISTEVITREQIKDSGATHLGDLIGRYIPGHRHKYDDLSSPIGLRGFNGETLGDDIKGYVLTLIDGHRIGTDNAAKISVDRIDHVEITRGPASALYGSAAMGGVINLITKKGDDNSFLTINGDLGSFDYQRGVIEGSTKVLDRLQLQLNASHEARGDYTVPEYNTVYNSGELKQNIGGNLTYEFNENHALRLGGNLAGVTGESFKWKGDVTYYEYESDTSEDVDKSHGYADLEYNGFFMEKQLHWRGMAYYLWDRNLWNLDSPAYDSYQNKLINTTIGTDQQLTWNHSSYNTIVVGATKELLEKESKILIDSQPAPAYEPNLEYSITSFFAQDALDLWGNRINMVAAARYDYFEVEAERPSTDNFSEFYAKKQSYGHLSPKLSMGVKFLDEMLRIRANMGEGFKTPSAEQLAANYLMNDGTRYRGNSSLKPETSLTYEAGADLFHELFTLNLGYFHSDYKDKIESVWDGTDSIVTFENFGDVEIAGIDSALTWYIGRTLSWNFELSLWTKVTYYTTKKDLKTGDEWLYVSDYDARSGLDLNFGGFKSQLSNVLVGPQSIVNYDAQEIQEKKEFSYWDLTMRYRFSKRWEARAAVFNLFDDRVEWVRGFIMPERNYRLGISCTF